VRASINQTKKARYSECVHHRFLARIEESAVAVSQKQQTRFFYSQQMFKDLYERYAYLARLMLPISENPLYKKFIQPWVRRRAPDHMENL